MADTDQSTAAVVYFANCAEHGLHGQRDECFVCDKPVTRVGYVRADLHLQVESARARYKHDWETRGKRMVELDQMLKTFEEHTQHHENEAAALLALARRRGIDEAAIGAALAAASTTRLASESCGRLLVGQGDDTYDPECVLPAGHEGICKPEEASDA